MFTANVFSVFKSSASCTSGRPENSAQCTVQIKIDVHTTLFFVKFPFCGALSRFDFISKAMLMDPSLCYPNPFRGVFRLANCHVLGIRGQFSTAYWKCIVFSDFPFGRYLSQSMSSISVLVCFAISMSFFALFLCYDLKAFRAQFCQQLPYQFELRCFIEIFHVPKRYCAIELYFFYFSPWTLLQFCHSHIQYWSGGFQMLSMSQDIWFAFNLLWHWNPNYIRLLCEIGWGCSAQVL